MELGDRVLVMRKGAIAQIGTPRDIYFAPQSRFVAEFIGAANRRRHSIVANWFCPAAGCPSAAMRACQPRLR